MPRLGMMWSEDLDRIARTLSRLEFEIGPLAQSFLKLGDAARVASVSLGALQLGPEYGGRVETDGEPTDREGGKTRRITFDE